MRTIKILRIWCGALILFIGGCGYTTSSILTSGESIHVDNFKNAINITEEVTDKRMYIGYRTGTELDITREVIDRFILDGNLRIASRKDADLILEGKLIDFTKESLRFDSIDNVIEFRIRVVISYQLTDVKKNKILSSSSSFTGESTYRVTGTFSKSEALALKDAVGDLAVRIVDKIVEGW